MTNLNPQEIDKFNAMASRWWDPEGPCKLLHELNPFRVKFIETHTPIKEQKILDVGCGGGILTESLSFAGGNLTGLDMACDAIEVARAHAHETGLNIHYVVDSLEHFAKTHREAFDMLTCLELIEHVPDPKSLVGTCASLVKPGGYLYFSTLNRTPKSFLYAILGAEYLLKLVPKGTHSYEHFIKPSELRCWARDAHLQFEALQGLEYHPLSQRFSLSDDVSVNYLMMFQRSIL